MTEKLFDEKYETSVLDGGSSAANFRPMPVVLLANKRDVPLLKIPRNKYSSYVAENGLLAWYETSAKDPTSMCHSVKQVLMAGRKIRSSLKIAMKSERLFFNFTF